MARGRALGGGRMFQDGDVWKLDFRDADGKRHIVTLARDRRTAEIVKARIINERDLTRHGLHDIVGQNMLVREVVAKYFEGLEHRVGWSLRYQATRMLKTFCDRWGHVPMRNLRQSTLRTLRDEIVAKGRGNSTANGYVRVITGAFNYCVRAKIISVNPLAGIEKLPTSAQYIRRKRRALNDDEIRRLLDAADVDDQVMGRTLAANLGGVRVPQRHFFQAMVETGARWSELRLATWGDLDVVECMLTLRAETTKSKRVRVIPLRAEFVEELRGLRILHERALKRLPTSGDRIFLSPWGRCWQKESINSLVHFRRCLMRAGILRVDQQGRVIDHHALRHTAASRMARAGVSITFAQRLLGHSDPKLTERIYTHLEPTDLRQAVEKVGGPRSTAVAAQQRTA